MSLELDATSQLRKILCQPAVNPHETQFKHTCSPLFIKFDNLIDLFRGLISTLLRFSDQIWVPSLLCKRSTANVNNVDGAPPKRTPCKANTVYNDARSR